MEDKIIPDSDGYNMRKKRGKSLFPSAQLEKSQ